MESTTSEKTLTHQGYHLVGSGAVKPCLWLNRSMRGGDQCYKHHFYGISSHRCVQMTPTLECNHLCLHCWRPIDDPRSGKEPMEPAELLEGILQGQKKFLSGYGGAKTTDQERLAEAREPRHVAISLMGEPTLYPYLKELIDLISRRGMTSFLVSNATHPEVLEELRPTQLYLSLNAPDVRALPARMQSSRRPLAQDPGVTGDPERAPLPQCDPHDTGKRPEHGAAGRLCSHYRKS